MRGSGMAILINGSTGDKIIIQPQHIFGRHPTTETELTQPEASRTHAVAIWDGECWMLQDISTNGTFINGKKLVRGEKTRINLEDEIQFGGLDVISWYVKDLTPPASMLLPLTKGLPIIYLNGINVLPSEDNPEVAIYQNARGLWMCENDTGPYELKMGDKVGSYDKQWKFVDGETSIETSFMADSIALAPKKIAFNFDVSQNEEHVSIKLMLDDREVDLGLRNHHYLVLMLARKFQEDLAYGMSLSECGWLDKDLLCKMLGQNENHINIQIYRFRKQFLDAYPLPEQMPQVIERRTGEIRFYSTDIQIIGGMKLREKDEYANKNVFLN